MSPRLIISGLLAAALATVAFSSSVAADSIDNFVPESASVGPGEVIQFRVDPGNQGCTRLPDQDPPAAVYQWTIEDSSAVVVYGPIQVFRTDFTSGLLEISVNAPQTSGSYLIVWTAIDEECDRGDATAPFVVTGSTSTPTTPTTPATPTTVAAPGALPSTGRSSDGLLWAALALAMFGAALTTLAARRS